MEKQEVYDFLVNMTKNMTENDLRNISKRFKGSSPIKDYLSKIVSDLDVKLNEAIYLILNHMDKPKECPDCGKRCRFQTFLKGYTKYCGKCGLIHSAETTRLILENKSVEEKQEIIRRTQETIKRKRDTIISDTIDISNLTRDIIKNYIVNYIGNDSDRIRGIGNHLFHRRPDIYQYLKNEQDKFGYDNNSAIIYMILNDILEPPKCSICNTNYCSFHFDVKSNTKKFSNYCSQCGYKYGGVLANKSFAAQHDNKTVFELQEYRDKGKQTLIENTGFEFATQNPETMQKIKDSSLKNNGGMGFASEKVLKTINETMLKTKGCTLNEYNGDPVRIQNMKQRYLEKYGVDCWNKTEYARNYFHNLYVTPERIKIVKELLSKYNLELISEYRNSLLPIKVRCTKCNHEFDLSCYNQIQQGMLNPYCRKCYPTAASSRSSAEIMITQYIQDKYPNLRIENNVRSLIDSHKEIDIYIPEKKLAIEYDGLYWHSSNDINPKSQGKHIEYHYDKYRLCKEKDIRLITIFENDPMDIILQFIMSILDGSEYVDMDRFEKYEDDCYLIDNRFYSYEFLKDNSNYKVIKRLDPFAWFWTVKDSEFIRFDEFKDSYCSDGSNPFEVAKEFNYNWIYDCGYQVIKKI